VSGLVLDAAYPRWSIGQLKSWHESGRLAGVIRYVGSSHSSKNIQPREFDELVAGGIPLGLVFESTGTDYTAGAAAGGPDGTTARVAAHACGFPDSRPIYSTVDRGDHANPALIDYQRAYNVTCGQRHYLEGFYGDRELGGELFGAGLLGWYWQTNARGWPGDALDDPRAAIIQRTSKRFPELASGAYDESDVFATDWGQYPAPVPSKPVPPASPPRTSAFPGLPGVTLFEQSCTLDEHGAAHLPLPVGAGNVASWGPIATPSPEKVGRYVPIPDVSLTIGGNGKGEVVLENGVPFGPASVRVLYT
jgi:Domain of unknown function (DUF1906)